MRRTLILFVAFILLGLPSALTAKSKTLTALKIHKVYVYAKLVRQDDTAGQQQVTWVKQDLSQITRWTVTNTRANADAVLIVVPHGIGYAPTSQASKSYCTSNETGMTCQSSDGSSLTVNCIGDSCWSQSHSGDYDSFLVAIPVRAGSGNDVKVVWDSDRAMVSGWLGHFDAMTGTADMESTLQSVVTLCRASGNGSQFGCERKVRRSRKQFYKSQRGAVVTLP